MKRFMYLSAGLLCLSLTLVAGIHIGQVSVEAHYAGTPVLAAGSMGTRQGAMVIAEDGSIWDFGGGVPSGWVEQPASPLPIPGTQVAWVCNDTKVVDIFGNGWSYQNGSWANTGPPPTGLPVQTEDASWGRIKHDHKGGGQ